MGVAWRGGGGVLRLSRAAESKVRRLDTLKEKKIRFYTQQTLKKEITTNNCDFSKVKHFC